MRDLSRLNKPRVVEADRTGSVLVHYESPGQLGNVTLCGITDWIHSPRGSGAATTAPVNCLGCLSVVEWASCALASRMESGT